MVLLQTDLAPQIAPSLEMASHMSWIYAVAYARNSNVYKVYTKTQFRILITISVPKGFPSRCLMRKIAMKL